MLGILLKGDGEREEGAEERGKEGREGKPSEYRLQIPEYRIQNTVFWPLAGMNERPTRGAAIFIILHGSPEIRARTCIGAWQHG